LFLIISIASNFFCPSYLFLLYLSAFPCYSASLSFYESSRLLIFGLNYKSPILSFYLSYSSFSFYLLIYETFYLASLFFYCKFFFLPNSSSFFLFYAYFSFCYFSFSFSSFLYASFFMSLG